MKKLSKHIEDKKAKLKHNTIALILSEDIKQGKRPCSQIKSKKDLL